MNLVGMLPVYNEVDIVEEVIQHLLSQGIDLVVLDNGSTDGSYEICKKFAEKGLITLNQVKTSKFDFPLILRILYDMALTRNPDWLIRSDQDEILESGTENLTLKEAIEQEDDKGCNLIQFNVFEFFATNDDNLTAKSIKDKFRYYSWQHDYAYRAWKHIPGVRVENEAGHMPIFPEGCQYRISEKKFVMRHYRFRNKEQAIKNNEQRILRTKDIPERKIGWYAHFDKISKKQFEPVDFNLLNKYNEDNNWNCEPKFQPYVMTAHKTRNELFSKDGDLIRPHLTISEMWAALKWRDEKISSLQKQFDELSSKNFVNGEGENSKKSIDLETKPFLIITGMHRSGTSFLARALNLAGVYLGNLDSIITHDFLSTPHKHNLRGHWENTKLLHLGEKTLSFSNGSWKDIPLKIEINEEIVQGIKESVKELTNHSSLMAGLKDPRILLCLEAWRPHLPKEIMIIGIFRHPLKVAESIKKRNDLSYQKSIDLWKIYNQKLLKHLEKYNGFLVNFDWPKEKIISELNQIYDKLGLSRRIDLLEWYTEELITSDERYDSSYELPNDVNEIYTKLLDQSKKNQQVKVTQPKLSEHELKLIIDGILSELQEQGIYFKKILEQKLNSVKSLGKNYDEQLIIEREKKNSEIINLKSDMNKIRNSFTWKMLRKIDKLTGKGR